MELLRMREPDSQRGVSLIETLVALLILSFVAVSTLAMFSQGMRLNMAGAGYTSITNLAKDKSEELLSLRYDDPDLAPDVVNTETITNPEELEIRWRVAEHSVVKNATNITTLFNGDPMVSTSAGSGNLKVIAVTVSSLNKVATGRRTVTVQGMKITE